MDKCYTSLQFNFNDDEEEHLAIYTHSKKVADMYNLHVFKIHYVGAFIQSILDDTMVFIYIVIYEGSEEDIFRLEHDVAIMHPELRPIQGKKWGTHRFKGKEVCDDEQKET